MEKIVFDKEMEFAIKFWKSSPEDKHWLNFKAVECAYIIENNIPVFNNYDLGNGISDCTDFDKAHTENPLCNGFIKWDGCMEIHELTYHFCGYTNFLQRLTRLIYTEAKEILGDNFDDSLARLNNLNKY